MSDEQQPPPHSLKKEPKFCRCRVCHEHFYAETISAARQACLAHAKAQHPEWGATVCFSPD